MALMTPIFSYKFKGCLLKRTVVLAVIKDVEVLVPWDAEEYDTNDFHSINTNPDRITIPATGVKIVVLKAHSNWEENATGHRVIRIYKNNQDFVGMASDNRTSSNTLGSGAHVETSATFVSPGDYFTVKVTQTSGGTRDLGVNLNRLWFALEVVE